MTRISSSWTFFYKRIFPVFGFGFLGVFVWAVTVPAILKPGRPDVIPAIFFPVFFGSVGYIVMKLFVWDLVDEVYDSGDFLLVRNKGREHRFALSDFGTVGYYMGMMNPPTVMLTLREPSSDLGKAVSFMPPYRLWPSSMHPVAKDLMVRIYEARQKCTGDQV
jgi:hypothetical protein